MNIQPTDIIDYVLGCASPELRERIEAAAVTDAKLAREIAMWRELRPALAAERRSSAALAESAAARVSNAIRFIQPAPAPSGLRRLWWELTRPAVGLTAAACALLIVATAWFVVGTVANEPQVASSVYVDFSAARDGLGTARQPFRTLDQGASSVPAGGTLKLKPGASAEPVRIDKPMRLTATDGPVRIGKI